MKNRNGNCRKAIGLGTLTKIRQQIAQRNNKVNEVVKELNIQNLTEAWEPI